MTKQILIATLSFLVSGAVAVAAEPAPLSHEEIKSTVDGHLGDVKSCMKENGAATGKLVVQFAIHPDGKVQDSKPKEHSSNDKLDHCIAKAFGRWSFPKPRGGVIMAVVYPFTFSAPPPPPKEGTLTQEQVVTTVHGKQADVDACMESSKDLDPKKKAAGVVTMAIVIAPSGAVSEAKIHDSTTDSPKLDQCILQKLKTWQFPKPDGGGEFAVLYPFAFGKGAKK